MKLGVVVGNRWWWGVPLRGVLEVIWSRTIRCRKSPREGKALIKASEVGLWGSIQVGLRPNSGFYDLPSPEMSALPRLNWWVDLLGECNLLGCVLSQQRFEATDIKALGAPQVSDSLCYSSWTDQFYLENKGKYILEAWGHADPKDMKRRGAGRERDLRPFGSSLDMFFLLARACPAWTRPALFRSIWGPRSSPRTFLRSVFEGFSLPCF